MLQHSRPYKQPPPSDRATRTRIFDALLSLFAFVSFGTLGWAIHVFILPLPIVSAPALVARYLYFLLWLSSITYFLGRAVLGGGSSLFHLAVFMSIGFLLGSIGGYFFAGALGIIIGTISGLALVGPAVFFFRHRQTYA